MRIQILILGFKGLKINSQAIGKPFYILLIDRCQPFGAIL